MFVFFSLEKRLTTNDGKHFIVTYLMNYFNKHNIRRDNVYTTANRYPRVPSYL